MTVWKFVRSIIHSLYMYIFIIDVYLRPSVLWRW